MESQVIQKDDGIGKTLTVSAQTEDQLPTSKRLSYGCKVQSCTRDNTGHYSDSIHDGFIGDLDNEWNSTLTLS
jgi:hypothetical protein